MATVVIADSAGKVFLNVSLATKEEPDVSLSDLARQAETTTTPGQDCKFVRLLNAHPEVREELRDLLDDRALRSTSIAVALRQEFGPDAPSESAVRRHRRGPCSKCDLGVS